MKSQYVKLNSHLKIHTLVAGDPSHPPLVLIHGWPTNCYLWRKIIPGLSNYFYVLAPDLPGHGKSEKPSSAVYDLPFFRNFILDFFNAFHLEQASLAAHDLGGMAGLSFAVNHPNRLDKFIIMDTSPYSQWPWMLRASIFLLKQKRLTPFFLSRFGFRQTLKTGFYNKNRISTETIDLFRTPWTDSKEGISAFSNTVKEPPERMVESPASLRQITVPTLILWAGNDFFFPFKIARRLHEDIKKSRLVRIDKAGHFLHEDQPEMIEKQMSLFLRTDKL